MSSNERRESSPSFRMLSFAQSSTGPAPWNHRPTVSSPLSSSPLRASSPLSQIDGNTLSQRQIQSSPIKPPKFKYAARQPRPNPVVRRREETQEKRRQEFLQNVRQKQEDKAWRRRDIEGQFLKQSLLTSVGQLTFDAPTFTESDIEDAMAYQHERSQEPEDDDQMVDNPPDDDEDLDAMFASYQDQQLPSASEHPRVPSPTLSDDDYDDLFAELIASETTTQTRQQQPNPPTSLGHSNFVDEDSAMSM